jgi:AraC-like DNA-binding protein
MRGIRAARLADILAKIKTEFSDPSFSSAALAQQLGLSRRYVNELLAENGLSFSESILELRLHKAMTMLTDAANDKSKISEIAWSCGFNDVGYFNRRFKTFFGGAPSDFRQ